MIIETKRNNERKFRFYLALGIEHNRYTNITYFRIVDDDGVTKCVDIGDCSANGIKFENLVYIYRDNSFYIYEPEIYELFTMYMIPNTSLWEEYFNNNDEVVNNVNEAIIKIAKRNHFEITKPHPYGIYSNIKIKIYDKYSKKQIDQELMCPSQEEQSYLFAYLIERHDQDYIDNVIDWLKRVKRSNEFNNNIIKAFKYLSSFNTEPVKSFFKEYLKDMYWDNDDIMIIVLDYLNRIDKNV